MGWRISHTMLSSNMFTHVSLNITWLSLSKPHISVKLWKFCLHMNHLYACMHDHRSPWWSECFSIPTKCRISTFPVRWVNPNIVSCVPTIEAMQWIMDGPPPSLMAKTTNRSCSWTCLFKQWGLPHSSNVGKSAFICQCMFCRMQCVLDHCAAYINVACSATLTCWHISEYYGWLSSNSMHI